MFVSSNSDFERIFKYDSAWVADTTYLPNASGIYYAVKNQTVVYIGKAISLSQHFNGNYHPKKVALLKMGGVVIFYRLVPDYRLLMEESREKEIFSPMLN